MVLAWSQIREIALILYGVLMCFQFVFGTDLLIRYFQVEKEARRTPSSFVFFLIGCGVIGVGIYSITAAYTYLFNRVDWVMAIQIAMPICNLSVFVIMAENYLKDRVVVQIRNMRFGWMGLVAIFVDILSLLMILVEVIDPDNIRHMPVYYPFILAIVVFSLYGFFGVFKIFFVKFRPKRDTATKILYGLGFGGIALLGSAIRWYYLHLEHFGYLFGFAVEILGWIGFRWQILKIPSYTELEWRSGLIEIHILLVQSGISLFYKSFSSSDESVLNLLKKVDNSPEDQTSTEDSAERMSIEKELVGPGIVGIKSMLSEITGSAGSMGSIQIGNRFLVSAQGSGILALLLAEQDLYIYQTILDQLVHEIEREYPILASGKFHGGNVGQFELGSLVEKYFSTEIVFPLMRLFDWKEKGTSSCGSYNKIQEDNNSQE